MSKFVISLSAGTLTIRARLSLAGLCIGVGLDDLFSFSVGLGLSPVHPVTMTPHLCFRRINIGLVSTVCWLWCWMAVLADNEWLRGPMPPAEEIDDG